MHIHFADVQHARAYARPALVLMRGLSQRNCTAMDCALVLRNIGANGPFWPRGAHPNPIKFNGIWCTFRTACGTQNALLDSA